MRTIFFLTLASSLTLAACTQAPAAPEQDYADTTIDASAAAAAEAERRALAEAEAARQAQLAAGRECMRAVLVADSQTSAISDYGYRVSAMKSISTEGCPVEFRTAYFDHIDAWARRGRIQTALIELNSDENAGTTIVASILATALELEATPIADHLEAERRLRAAGADADAGISETFHTVERIALQYGVSLG
jgi:hypothetical protein